MRGRACATRCHLRKDIMSVARPPAVSTGSAAAVSLAVAALSAAAVLAAILALVSLGHVGLHDAAAYVAIVVAVMAPVAYFYRNIREERAEERRKEEEKSLVICGTCDELEGALDALDRSKHGSDALSFLIGGREVFFMNRRLHHGLYDSVVSSGRLYLVASDSRQKTQDAYDLIKNHNTYLAQTQKLAHSKDERDLEYADALYKRLDEIEKRMAKEIPGLVCELRGSIA